MTSDAVYNIILIAWLMLSPLIFTSLFFIVAPYGRHIKSGWGPALDSKLGWVIMEACSPIIFAICFILGKAPLSIPSVIFLLMWEAHYIHRAFIYPFSLKSSRDKMPLSIALSSASSGFRPRLGARRPRRLPRRAERSGRTAAAASQCHADPAARPGVTPSPRRGCRARRDRRPRSTSSHRPPMCLA